METEVFELREMADIVGMPFTKAKNWTVDRPFTIEPSIRRARGRGSPALYSRDDLYLMGLANYVHKAGFAANAVGRVVEAVRKKYPKGIGKLHVLMLWRENGELAYTIRAGEANPSAMLWTSIDIASIVSEIEKVIEKREA